MTRKMAKTLTPGSMIPQLGPAKVFDAGLNNFSHRSLTCARDDAHSTFWLKDQQTELGGAGNTVKAANEVFHKGTLAREFNAVESGSAREDLEAAIRKLLATVSKPACEKPRGASAMPDITPLVQQNTDSRSTPGADVAQLLHLRSLLSERLRGGSTVLPATAQSKGLGLHAVPPPEHHAAAVGDSPAYIDVAWCPAQLHCSSAHSVGLGQAGLRPTKVLEDTAYAPWAWKEEVSSAPCAHV
mmetsp:Transcript_41212/g.95449  ORF Transcript_41212/g.95449 Transcript_41212/m.95449 type:complete len:242 (-) Transcript_41212:241-966(-)